MIMNFLYAVTVKIIQFNVMRIKKQSKHVITDNGMLLKNVLMSVLTVLQVVHIATHATQMIINVSTIAIP